MSAEIVLEFVENALLRLRVALEVVAVAHLLQLVLLVAAQGLRHVDADVHNDVAAAVAVAFHHGQTLAAQPLGGAGLGAGFDVYLQLGALDGGDFHLAAQSGRGEVEQQVVDQVGLLADEGVVLFLLNVYLDVAVYAVVAAGVALAGHVHHHAVGHTGGYLDLYHFLAFHNALALALLALVLDDGALTLAGGTDSLRLHHAEHGALGAYRVAAAVAGGALLAAAAGLGTRAGAVGAAHVLAYLELLGDTGRNLLKRKAYLQAKVAAAVLRTALLTAAETAETAKAAMTAEYVAEHGENVVHAETAAAETAESAGGLKAELVILLALLRVMEHLVGLGGLLEFLLGFLVAGVAVGVVFDGYLAVGGLDLVVRGLLAYA